MKVRLGFISNSSSSSFVLVTTKDKHNEAIAKLDPYAQAVIKALITEEKKFGLDLIYLSDWRDAGGNSNYDNLEINVEKPEEYEYEGDYLAVNKYEKELGTDNYLGVSTDFH